MQTAPLKYYIVTIKGRKALALGAIAIFDAPSGNYWMVSRKTGQKIFEVSPDNIREISATEAEQFLAERLDRLQAVVVETAETEAATKPFNPSWN